MCQSMSDNVKVVIKIRPLIDREKNAGATLYWTTNNGREIHSTKVVSHSFIYDRVFEAERSNLEVYQETAKPIVRSAMLGFNGTIFAYGQTSSGKTYTIMGKPDSWGVIPLSIGEIFETIENTPNRIFLLRVSYMEIYNENVTDLLSGQSKLKIHENQNGDVYVGDLAEEIVRDPETIYTLLQKGENRRHVGETNMNDKSSRSHTIFRIIIESREFNSGDMENTIPEASDSCDNIVTVSHLNIVDLAGSERAAQTGATGDRLKEGCAINKSLFTLAQVISKLSENAGQPGQSSNTIAGLTVDTPQFVNFRDSKLTRILQNSLGGNSKTAIICTVTPASLDETLSTLKFANRAKDIKNKPIKNEVGSDEAMLRRCQKQINELKKQINDLSGSSNIQALQIEKDNLAKQLSEKEEKISQLMHLICISSKITLSPAQKTNRDVIKNRRITWCPGINNKMMVFSPFPINSKRYKPEVPPVNEVPESPFIAVDRDAIIRDFDVLEKERISSTDLVNDRRKFCDNNCQTEEITPISENSAVGHKSLTTEIEKLQEEKKLLFHQYKSLISKYRSQNADVAALKSDLECTKKLNQELDEENRRLLDRKDESRIFHQDELESLTPSRDQCQKLTEEIVQKEEKLEKLNQELQEANRQFEQVMTENWTINKKLRKLTHENLQKENLLQEKDVELESLRVEISSLKVSCEMSEGGKRELDQLMERIDEKDRTLQKREEEMKIMRAELDRFKAEQTFAEENKALTSKFNEQEKMLRHYEEEISVLKDAFSRSEQQLVEKDELLREKNLEIETLRAEKAKIQLNLEAQAEESRKFASYVDELNRQNEVKQKILTDYESELETVRQKVQLEENLDGEYNDLMRKFDQKENVLLNNELDVYAPRKNLSQLQLQLIQKDETLNNKESELGKMWDDLDNTRINGGMCRKFESRVDELMQQYNDQQEKLKHYEFEVSLLRQELQSKKNVDENKALEICKLMDDLSELRHQLIQKDALLKNSKLESEVLCGDLDKIKINEKIHEENNQKLENRVNQLLQQNKENREKLDHYEWEIVVLRQQIDSKKTIDDRNNELIVELGEKEDDLRKSENEISRLSDILSQIRAQLLEKDEMLNTFKNEVESLRCELNQMKTNEKIREKDFGNRINDLIQQDEENRQKLKDYQRDIHILRQSVDAQETLHEKNNELTIKVQVTEKAMRIYEQELSELTSCLSKSDDQLAEKTRSLIHNEQIIHRLRCDLEESKANIEKFESYNKELIQQNEDYRRKFDGYEREIDILQQQINSKLDVVKENQLLCEKLASASQTLIDNKCEIANLRSELTEMKSNESNLENIQKLQHQIDELSHQNEEKRLALNDFGLKVESLLTELNTLKQNERMKEEKFKRHVSELIDQVNQKEGVASNYKRDVEILNHKLKILHQSRRLDELQKETKQKSRVELQQLEIEALRRKLDEKKIAEKEHQRKIEELEAKISEQLVCPPPGSLCKGGIVEEHSIHMLNRKLYRITKNVERLEKQIEIVTSQRDEAVSKLVEFEQLRKDEQHRPTACRSSIDFSKESEHVAPKIANGSDVNEQSDEILPILPQVNNQTFTLPRKSVLESVENISSIDKSKQELREQCSQQ